MGLKRRILSSLKPKQEEEKPSHFVDNGSKLLTELLRMSNGRYDIPIRSFTAKELAIATKSYEERLVATNSYGERVFAGYETVMFGGHFEGREILVNNWKCGFVHTRDMVIRDIVTSSYMSRHKNVLKLVGCCLESELPASVYEYAGNKLLCDVLDPESGNRNRLLSWKSRIKIGCDIASTILYLHTAFPTPVIHRNLKPSKVIIDESGVAKLFDFTLAISLPPGKLKVKDDFIAGTFGFLDPDYARSGYVTQKTDVYSFGMLLLVLLTGKTMISKNQEGEKVHVLEYVKHYVANHQYHLLTDPGIFEDDQRGVGNENLLVSFVDLALRCTRENGEDRPDMIDVAKQLRLFEKAYSKPLPSNNNS